MPLRLSEETDRVEHVPSARELTEQQRRPWARLPTHDRVPSGRLRIDLGGSPWLERKSFWADRASWTLEDKLPELLREVAVRVDDLRLRREAQLRAQAEYEQAVERERQRARERAAQAHRHKALDEQLGKWRQAEEMRRYATATAQRISAVEAAGEEDAAEIAAARDWLAWIESQAAAVDPLDDLPSWPKPPRLPDYELAKFMEHVPEPLELRYRPEQY